MKRLFSLLTAFALAAALCAPVMADDVTTPDVTAPTPTPTAAIDTTSSDGVYVSAYSVTDTAGGEVTTVQVGDKINIVLKVVDHASPGARQAAAARWFQSCGSSSAPGRLCHGSMHTKRTGFAGADQISE